MAVGDLITDDYQVEYNGVVANGVDGIEVVRLEVFDLPDLRTGDRVRAGDDGMYPGTDLVGGRLIEAELEAWAQTDDLLAPVIESLLLMTSPQRSELPLVMRIAGWDDDLYVLARPRRRNKLSIKQDTTQGVIAGITVQYFSTDPRLYSLTETGTALSVPTSTSGMTFPESPPITFGAGSSASETITNLGTFDSPPRATLVGPLTNPQLENVTTGQILALTGSLASGETMHINFLNRTVLLEGTASRYSWVDDPNGWWMLQPGDNEIRLNGTGAGSATMYTRSAWV